MKIKNAQTVKATVVPSVNATITAKNFDRHLFYINTPRHNAKAVATKLVGRPLPKGEQRLWLHLQGNRGDLVVPVLGDTDGSYIRLHKGKPVYGQCSAINTTLVASDPSRPRTSARLLDAPTLYNNVMAYGELGLATSLATSKRVRMAFLRKLLPAEKRLPYLVGVVPNGVGGFVTLQVEPPAKYNKPDVQYDNLVAIQGSMADFLAYQPDKAPGKPSRKPATPRKTA